MIFAKQGVQQLHSPEELHKAPGVDPYFTETTDASAPGQAPLRHLEGSGFCHQDVTSSVLPLASGQWSSITWCPQPSQKLFSSPSSMNFQH